MSAWKRLLVLLATATLAACGGGGSDNAGTPGVGGGGNGGTARAEDLTLVLSANSLVNGGSSTVTATATAVDRNRNVVAGIPVTFTVDAGATIAPAGTVSDAAGMVTAEVRIGSDRSNRVVTITAKSGTLERTASFSVTGATLTASVAKLVNVGSTNNVVIYTLVDSTGAAMPGQAVAVSGSGLASGSGNTDQNGKFSYTYTAPSTAGTLTLVATAAGAERTEVIEVSAGTSAIAPAPEAPVSASLTATPTVVSVNSAGSTANQVELRALFVGPGNRPIPRVRARFDLAGNANNTDGVVTWIGDYAYSDENGIARATFTPGQRSSPTNGVTVRVCYDQVDFVSPDRSNACVGIPQRSAPAELTVASEALAVSLRTNEFIKSGLNNLTYIKEYVVMVVDSAGQAKADVQITPSVDLNGYYKGDYGWNGQRWVQVISLAPTESYRWTGSAWTTGAGAVICPNEDVNRNGIREAQTPGATVPDLGDRQEDLNWNGDLDPRKSDVAIKMVGATKTDANGLAILQIEYGRNLGSWINYTITVTAAGISGTEARTRVTDVLPVDASALTSENAPPAFAVSPYGIASVCTNPN